MMVVLLCCHCATGGRLVEEKLDARLQEAQAAFDEAKKLRDAGEYSEARARAEHALALRETVLGGAHPEVARCLLLVGELLYLIRWDLAHAEPLFQRALAIQEAALGPNHPDVAQTLTDLANLYTQQGQDSRVEPLFQRALAIREAAFGPNHPNVARSRVNIAYVYMIEGLYGRAEPLYQHALALQEAALGKSHPDLAPTLNDLGRLYMAQGLYSKAEPIFQRSLAIREAAFGHHHPGVAVALGNLARLYAAQGLNGRAEPLFQRSLAIFEATPSKSPLRVAMELNDLARLYAHQGLYGRAEPLLQRALAIHEALPGANFPNIALTLDPLAQLYLDQGLYSRAEPLLQSSLSIWEAAVGSNHPQVAQTLHHLARLRLAQHRLSDALPLFTRSFAISEHRLRQEALNFSESSLASFLQHLRADEQVLYALLRAHPEDARVRRLALSAVLLLKGRSLEETAHISRTLYNSLGAVDRDTFERLRGLRTHLASLSLAGPGSLSPEAYRQRLAQLAAEGDDLEADLARRSAPLRSLTSLPPPAEIVERVAAALSKDSALVELIAYRDSPLIPTSGIPPSGLPGPPRYLALVLFPDATTRAVDLGPAEPIDRAASRLRTALANRDASFQATARELHRLAFQPLLPLLGDTRRLFLSPDGQLSLVPFATLHDGRGFLVDSFDFLYLNSGRELLPRPQEVAPSSSIFVLADPDFTASPRAVTSASKPIPTRAEPSASLERFFSIPRADLSSSAWVPLPGTRQEAQSIQRLLPQAQLFLGPDATKQRLLHLPTPGILHLATHGFFLENSPTPEGSRAVGHFGALGDKLQAPGTQEPLLRSGLVLAGAHASAPDSSTSSAPRPDATLATALELAGLNLWGTQLVVLSACDTGRGDIHLGQGVYGLRRALVAAGAETVVMSLWKVNDDSTRLLMELYYRNLLRGQGRASALHEAMRSFRVSHPHPHDWAPFIALGSDAPLQAITPTARAGQGRTGPSAGQHLVGGG
jgi:CHAT domain-containing protein/Tfp pilus assembly protein PilF